MIAGRRRSVIFFTVFGICLVAIAVALNVSWVLLNWRMGVLAILGISRARIEPVYRGAELMPRLMRPSNLHREPRRRSAAAGTPGP